MACHARSVSLTSSTHPLTLSVEEQLNRLKSSEAASSSVCHKLGDLKDLYERIEDLLQLSLAQRAISNEQDSELVEGILDGSLRLLDVCGTTRDIFSQMKQCLQDLASSFRRRKGGESGLASEVGAYMSSKKRLNKVISKCFANLKKSEKICTSGLWSKDSDMVAVVSMLKEAEKISLAAFESLLCFVSQPMARSKPGGWSLVSKLLLAKGVSCEGQVDANQVEKLDSELLVLCSKKTSKEINTVQLQNMLDALELSFQELEEELECVYRRLLKTRVSLLNIFNH